MSFLAWVIEDLWTDGIGQAVTYGWFLVAMRYWNQRHTIDFSGGHGAQREAATGRQEPDETPAREPWLRRPLSPRWLWLVLAVYIASWWV